MLRETGANHSCRHPPALVDTVEVGEGGGGLHSHLALSQHHLLVAGHLGPVPRVYLGEELRQDGVEDDTGCSGQFSRPSPGLEHQL